MATRRLFRRTEQSGNADLRPAGATRTVLFDLVAPIALYYGLRSAGLGTMAITGPSSAADAAVTNRLPRLVGLVVSP